MLRVSLIGAGDIQFHYFELLGISSEKFYEEVEQIANALATSQVDLVLLPDRGVSFEVAKKYKEFSGGWVYGTVPLSDRDFGIGHLKQYMDTSINGVKLFDEIIDTQNWYKQDLTHCIYGDVVLMLGNSLGSLGELVYGYYLYKLFLGDKPHVKVQMDTINPDVRAGRTVPFSVIVYTPFMKEKLSFEIEAYVKKLGGGLYYAASPERVTQILREISSYAERVVKK